jgi:hypothetical protein
MLVNRFVYMIDAAFMFLFFGWLAVEVLALSA